MSQKEIIEALHKADAYDENVKNINLIQTHISYVFLTGIYAYKIKKPVNFGFLDFSTLEKRKFYCEEELRLNRRLCGDMYVGVLPITVSGNGEIKINGKGKIVEYTLKMKEMPQEKMMATLLMENKITTRDIDKLAKIVFKFHNSARTNAEIKKYGSLKIIKYNWDENFKQTKEFIGKTITKDDYNFIFQKINNFLQKKRGLFENRVKDGKIKECHGDLHLSNIFITDKIYIFDAIEFNKRFRFSDIASDVAFFAMDLDFRGRIDLSDRFVKKYLELSKDDDLIKVLPFYKCYRAFVRGKVTSFKLNDSNISEADKMEARKAAKKYFNLSVKYAKQLLT